MAWIFRLVFVVVVFVLRVRAQGDECYAPADIAAAVLGTFFSTLAVVAVAALVYWFVCRPKKGKSSFIRPKHEDFEAHAYDNPYFQDEDEEKPKLETKTENGSANSEGGKSSPNKTKVGNDTKQGKKNKNSKTKQFANVFTNNKSHTIQRALDDSCIQQEPEKLEVRLRGCDFTGLGFNICGNIRHGIYVRDVLHRGPASESGKIKAGDRILGVTVCFDKITIEDALTILSYASPYDVTLYVQKTSEGSGAPFLPGHQKRGSTSSSVSGAGMGTGAEVLSHPVYRSQSSDDVSQISRDSGNNKRCMSLSVVPPRIKGGSGGMHRVEPITEGDATIEKSKKETIVSVEVNEVQKEAADVAFVGRNPFGEADGSEGRKMSTQTSLAFIAPRDLTVEIPVFGLMEATSGAKRDEEMGVDVEVGPVCFVPADSPHLANEVRAENGPGVDVPDARRTFVRELTAEESLKNFDVPAMDLDDVHVSLDEALNGAKDARGITDFREESPRSNLASIKKTIVRKLSEENILDAIEVEKTVVLPRVDLKTPSAADFEGDANTKSSSDDSLDENITYFESKMQKVLQNSPKVKPKRNSIPGKRRAPQPPFATNGSQPSSPTDDVPQTDLRNPFVEGIPSWSSVQDEANPTAVVFLKPNNVTSVRVDSGTSSPEPKSPKRNLSSTSPITRTNFDEGLDKASGEERFNSIPRSGSIPPVSGNDKSSRRASSLDDLTKIEDTKPLPLERAVSMDLNNPDELVVEQPEEGDRNGDQQLFDSYFTMTTPDKPDVAIDLKKWVQENVDKTKIEEYLEKGIKRKQQEAVNTVTYVRIPLNRSGSVSSSSLSEDSIENERSKPKRMMLVDSSLKTYDSDSDEDPVAPSRAHRSATSPIPTITIPVIPPIINTRELSRTPSPNKDPHEPRQIGSVRIRYGENGEHDGSATKHETTDNVTTMSVNEGKTSNGSSGGQTVLVKTLYVSGPTRTGDDSGLESPSPILQLPQ